MGTEKLIKQKPEQQSEVWEFDDRFRKKWLYKDKQWLTDHYKMLESLCEDGYLKGFGFDENHMWLDTTKLKGQLASTCEQTPEFMEKIHKFCIEHYYSKTKPYAHFDWDLRNMVVEGDKITLIDWDHCREYSEGQVLDKMDADLKKGFGEKYNIPKHEYKKVVEKKSNASTEKLKFVIELYSDYWKNPPIAEVYINEDSKYKDFIKGTKDKPDVISFECELTEGDKCNLIIDRYNKSEKETNFKDGKVLNDQMLYIKSIEIDEIDIGALVYEGVYKPVYPSRWKQQQKEAGKVLPESFKNATSMGHNGTWTLQFASPFYMWLLDNLY